jgi:hypothetical protein
MRMREFLLAVAVCVALVGCDSKPEGGSKDGGAKAPDGGTKTTEPVKAAAAKHPWGSFKKGSFVKTKTVMDMETPKMKQETSTTTTLKDLTADEYTIEMEMVMPNVPTPTKSEQKLPLKAPDGPKTAEGPKPKTGSEEIEVAGKKLKCTWTETESEANGVKSVTKVWSSDEIPGHMAKMTMKNPSMTMTTEVVSFEVK